MPRDLLHKKDLSDFSAWCVENGIGTRPGRGDYQVLQVWRNNQWHVVYERDDTHAGNETVHLTVPATITGLVRSFIRDKKGGYHVDKN